MIEGIVLELSLAIVPLELLRDNEETLPVDAVLDTGFTGELTLAAAQIVELGLSSIGTRVAELANGESVTFDLYAARVLWHGAIRDVSVLHSETQALIGMALLENSRLIIDVVDKGLVQIEKLPTSKTPD